MSALPPVRLAMVGGGPGSFIGPVHRMAAELDRQITLVAGAFSRDAGKSRAAGAAWGIGPDRCHADYRAMIADEAARPDGARLIAIVTPNASHFPIARAALEAGLHVLSDKPATATLAEARALRAVVEQAGGLYGLTFTYTGYPLVRAARDLVARGDIGAVRKIVVEYSQGWLWRAIEHEQGQQQAEWRTDPAQSGQGGCIGDIGVHAFNIAEFVSGEEVTSLCADLSRIVPGRMLDDDCNVLIRTASGAPGVLHASQVATGDRNGLSLRIWGETGGIAWRHDASEQLTLDRPGVPTQVWHAGESYTGGGALRLPAGHPQGFIEAFANIYRDMADAIRSGQSAPLVPGIAQGVRSMAFVAAAIASSDRKSWVDLREQTA